MSTQIDVSVIIPTYNRVNSLKECIKGLLEQTMPKESFEIIIVDDGSDANIEQELESANILNKINYIKQAHLGRSAARNLGVNHAKGDLIALLDDDCSPDSQWLSELKKAVTSTKIGGVAGQTISFNSGSVMDQYYRHIEGPNWPLKKPINLAFFPSCNCLFRRDAYLATGGFDSQFEPGEDRDLCGKILQLGYVFEYAADAKVTHYFRSSFFAFLKTYFQYGQANAHLKQKWQANPILATSKTSILRKILPWICPPAIYFLCVRNFLREKAPLHHALIFGWIDISKKFAIYVGYISFKMKLWHTRIPS